LERAGMVITLWVGQSRFRILGRQEIFLFSKPFIPALGPTQPPLQWLQGTLFREVKSPRCGANHSPRLVPRLRMSGTVPPLPQYPFMVCTGTTLPSTFTSGRSFFGEF
jgi:hypothetical protein